MHATLAKIQAAQTTHDLWLVVSDFARQAGADKISYHHYGGTSGPGGTQRQVAVNAVGFSDDWVCHYIQDKLFLVDPIPEFARQSTKPFRWDEIDRLMRLTPAQRDYLAEMQAAGIGAGVAFQVYGPNLRNGYVGLGFPDPSRVPDATGLRVLQCVAQAAHLRYCELTEDMALGSPDLSPREREVLDWIAQGKSNSVIAQILGVSAHTVDTMVRRLFSKLGVADRTTAAIRGVGSGLVLPGR